MNIDIYSNAHRRFIAVSHMHAVPEPWASAKFFKTIELKCDDVRIGMLSATRILVAIEKDGYAVI
ncbi:hypothetical protein [Xanthomonas arboricola]|uniref:hypothetical protein n=1 Tax=Xanthomonas arboricola TaxID=56448 RepID=UPI000C817DE5|nr:hypothetical protein [Xanthomonas arboricola]PPU25501.1 hypothetical protein XarCFBP6762_14640 [Xanthomonas arboricola]SOU00900.1 hypothetical protein CFBP6762_02782 [Xanthomonas arboricola pv. fragariae]